jgi:hypothetical protein
MLMIGERTVAQEQLFYEFSLERHMPTDHLLRSIDRFVDLSSLREHLRPFYSRHARERRDDALLSRQQVRLQCLRIEASLLQRRVPRSIHEGARDMVRDLSKTDAWLISRARAQEGRDAVRAFEAHSEAGPIAITWPMRCPRRVPPRRSRPEPPQDGQAARSSAASYRPKGD